MASISGPERGKLRDAMADTIVHEYADPAKWMGAVKKVAVALRLDPARAVYLNAGSLQIICYHLVEEAAKQGRTTEQIKRAYEGLRK